MIELREANQANAEIWHEMISRELFDLPLSEAREILCVDEQVKTLEMVKAGKAVGFIALDPARAEVLWVFVRQEERNKGWATEAVDELIKTHRTVSFQGAPRGWVESWAQRYEVDGLEGNEPFIDVTVTRCLGQT